MSFSGKLTSSSGSSNSSSSISNSNNSSNINSNINIISKGTITGAQWTSRLFFDQNCDERSSSGRFELTEEEFVSTLNRIISDEKILVVEMWKQPLSDYQLTDFLLYHSFIVLHTNEWWWSIEKNAEGLTMQRSKKSSERVVEFYRRYPRKKGFTGIRKMKAMILPDADCKLSNFYVILYENHELRKTYHWYDDNCQDFAHRIYNGFEKKQEEGRMEKIRRFLPDIRKMTES